MVGRLVDAFGARPVFLTATSTAGLAGLLGVFAPNLGTLIAVRIVLGLATCAGYPASMHLIRYEANRKGLATPATALSVLSIAGQATVVLGPTIGGLLVGLGGWRAVFGVNVPLALACLVLGLIILPREKTTRRGELRLDVPGMASFAVSVVCLLLFFVDPSTDTWYLPALAVGALTLLVVRETQTDDPFIDLRLLRATPALTLVYARAVLSGVFSYSFLYGFTQWLQEGAGFSASQAGLLLMPMSVLALTITTLTGRAPQIRGKLFVGALAQILAAALMLLCAADSPVWLFIVVSLAVGLPSGLVNLANQNALFAVAPADRTASSAGLLRTFLYFGAIVSSTTDGALMGDGVSTTGMHDIALVLLALAVVFAGLTLCDRSLRRTPRKARPA